MDADALYAPVGPFEVLAPSLGVQITGAPRMAACAAPRAIRMGAVEPRLQAVDITLDLAFDDLGLCRVVINPARHEIAVYQHYSEKSGGHGLRLILGAPHHAKDRARVLQAVLAQLEAAVNLIPQPKGNQPQ